MGCERIERLDYDATLAGLRLRRRITTAPIRAVLIISVMDDGSGTTVPKVMVTVSDDPATVQTKPSAGTMPSDAKLGAPVDHTSSPATTPGMKSTARPSQPRSGRRLIPDMVAISGVEKPPVPKFDGPPESSE